MAAIMQIEGVKGVLQELYYMDRRLHKEITGRLKTSAQPIANDIAAQGFPDLPLSRWGASTPGQRTAGGFPKYNGASARAGIKVRTGGRKNRMTGVSPILKIVQTDPAGSVFDIAGRKQTGKHPTFIPNLKAEHGNASRSMWPAVLSKRGSIEGEIQAAINDATQAVSASIASGKLSRTSAASSRASSRSRTSFGRFGVRGI
jgi:hypothetical protein